WVEAEDNLPMVGNGSYVEKYLGNIRYVELDFPSDFNWAEYNDELTPEQIAAGAKAVVVEGVGSRQGPDRATFVPAGTPFQVERVFMNKEAADQLKAALQLQ